MLSHPATPFPPRLKGCCTNSHGHININVHTHTRNGIRGAKSKGKGAAKLTEDDPDRGAKGGSRKNGSKLGLSKSCVPPPTAATASTSLLAPQATQDTPKFQIVLTVKQLTHGRHLHLSLYAVHVRTLPRKGQHRVPFDPRALFPAIGRAKSDEAGRRGTKQQRANKHKRKPLSATRARNKQRRDNRFTTRPQHREYICRRSAHHFLMMGVGGLF